MNLLDRVSTEDWHRSTLFLRIIAEGRRPALTPKEQEALDNRAADLDYLKWVNGYSDPRNERFELDETGPGSALEWISLVYGTGELMENAYPGGPVSAERALFDKFGSMLGAKTEFPYSFMENNIERKEKGLPASPKQAKWYGVFLKKLEQLSKAHGGEPPKKKPKKKFTPSAYQQAIFDWVKDAAGKSQAALVVDAKAGSGKSTTMEEALTFIPKNQKVVFLAFNTDIASALAKRVEDKPNVEAATINAYGRASVLKAFTKGGKQPELVKNKNRLACEALLAPLAQSAKGKNKERIAETYQSGYAYDMGETITKRKMMGTLDKAGEMVFPPWKDVLERFEIDLPAESKQTDKKLTQQQILDTLEAGFQQSVNDTTTMEFADQVLWPVMHDLPIISRASGKKANLAWAMIDEVQDLAPLEREFAKRLAPRHMLVGDPNQCAPPGSLVSLPGGRRVPIESLRNGDKVVAFSRESKAVVGRGANAGYPIKVGERYYEGPLVRVRTVSGLQTRTTPNHRWLVRWRDRERDHDTCVVYIMRKGDRYRVGWCQLFSGSDHTVQLTARARVERADAMWVLRPFEARGEASIYESVIATRYGLPTIPFHPVDGAKYLTTEAIESFFDAVCGQEHIDRAERCLREHGRDSALPLWPPVGKSFAKMGRTTLFETYAANLEPGLMALPVQVESNGKEIAYQTIESADREDYAGPVHSLEVEKYGTYIQDGLITHNSIYAFKGSDPDSMEKMQNALGADEKPLSICYRCPQAVVSLAQHIVPGIEAAPNAPPGEVASIKYEEFFDTLKPGDFVLCSMNAPNIGAALSLLAQGKKANVVGRDIGKSLSALISMIGGKVGHKKMPIDEFAAKVQAWHSKETKRLTAEKKEHLIQGLDDKRDCLGALMSKGDVESAGDLVKVIQSLFVDDPTPAINFSSIHKAKGLEADNVFIQRPDLLPMPMAIKSGDPIQIQQSYNLGYVAITRAKKRLTLVAPPPKEEGEESVPVHPTAWASAMGGSAVDQLADIVAPPAPKVTKKKVTKKKVAKKKVKKDKTPAASRSKKIADLIKQLGPETVGDWEDVDISRLGPSMLEGVTLTRRPLRTLA